MPTVFALLQNYPNPFNPSTKIRYEVPMSAQVKITIFDILGREVATLVNGIQEPGVHQIEWRALSVSTGVYFYRMEARALDGNGNFTAVKKLLFVK